MEHFWPQTTSGEDSLDPAYLNCIGNIISLDTRKNGSLNNDSVNKKYEKIKKKIKEHPHHVKHFIDQYEGFLKEQKISPKESIDKEIYKKFIKVRCNELAKCAWEFFGSKDAPIVYKDNLEEGEKNREKQVDILKGKLSEFESLKNEEVSLQKRWVNGVNDIIETIANEASLSDEAEVSIKEAKDKVSKIKQKLSVEDLKKLISGLDKALESGSASSQKKMVRNIENKISFMENDEASLSDEAAVTVKKAKGKIAQVSGKLE